MRGIRRKEKEITEKENLVKILQQSLYVTVATCKDKVPYLFTVSHGYENGKIYFHCASKGKKIDYLKNNNLVWGQAIIDKGYVQGKCDHLYMTCQFKGKVSFIDDVIEKRHALEVMIRKLDDDPGEVIKAQLTEKSVKKVTIGCIDIEYMSGKKSTEVIVTV